MSNESKCTDYPEHALKSTGAAEIYPFEPSIFCSDRNLLNGHRSALIWFTGLSGSGKSTLAHAVEAHLFKMGVRSYVLDGDNIRTGLNRDLGLGPEDRKENIRRIAEVAKIMVDAGILVFAAFIAPYRDGRNFVRALMENSFYYECYVRCPLEVCESRDPKNLYKKARAGQIKNLTGIGSPYEEPESPELIIDTARSSIDQSVVQVVNFLLSQKVLFKR